MRLILGLFFLGYGFSAAASSPSMIEGPPGCSWDATVNGGGMISSATDVTFFSITLDKEHGRCMEYVPLERCGTVGKQLRIAVPGTVPQQYTSGETLRVWVNGSTASVEQPACTKMPSMR